MEAHAKGAKDAKHFIDRFQQTGAGFGMHLEGRVENDFGQLIFGIAALEIGIHSKPALAGGALGARLFPSRKPHAKVAKVAKEGKRHRNKRPLQCYTRESRTLSKISCARAKADPSATLSILNPPSSILVGCGFAALR